MKRTLLPSGTNRGCQVAHTSIHNVLSRTGGIRPPERHRSKTALSLSEREEISRALAAGETLRSIAARLRRAPSTVSRELKRNGGREGYRATQADSVAWDRALRPKRCKLAENRALASVVADKLRLLWDPIVDHANGWRLSCQPRQKLERARKSVIAGTPDLTMGPTFIFAKRFGSQP